MTYWSGMRPLPSAVLSRLEPYLDSHQISCCCPVSWRSYSFGSVGSVALCTPAVVGGSCGWPVQSPGSGSESYLSWSDLLMAFFLSGMVHQQCQETMASSTLFFMCSAGPASPNAADGERHGQFSHPHDPKASSTCQSVK